VANAKKKGLDRIDLTPCLIGAPGRIRTHDPLVRSHRQPIFSSRWCRSRIFVSHWHSVFLSLTCAYRGLPRNTS